MSATEYSAHQQTQLNKWSKALGRDCPVCHAKAGEPCMPASLTIPHLPRYRDDEGNDAA